MEQNFQTSFIPKKPIVKEPAVTRQPISILLIGALVILFIVALGTGGLYFYKGTIQKNIDDMIQQLNLAKNRFEPSKITELQLLDKRLRSSTEILGQHITIVPVFTALEKITMKTVRFTKFSYDLGGNVSAPIDIKMSGQAIGYRSLALQADLLATDKNLINPVLSNLTLDDKGNVLFDLNFSVSPTFVNYKQALLTQS